LPKMHVTVKRDDDMPRGFLDYVWEFIGGGGGGEQEAYMSAPIDQSLVNKETVSSGTEDNIEANGQFLMTGRNQMGERGDVTLSMQSNAQIKQWNPDIQQIHEKPADIIISESERIAKEKVWETPVE